MAKKRKNWKNWKNFKDHKASFESGKGEQIQIIQVFK